MGAFNEQVKKLKKIVYLLIPLVCTGFASRAFSQTEWQKYQNNPVMVKDTTLPGIREWAGIGEPTILFENDTFKMWYVAVGVSGIGDTIPRGRISYAYSTDGIDWIKRNPPVPVLDVGDSGTWDSRWLDTPDILKDSSGYKLYYYGDSLTQSVSGIGLAVSSDGINWQKDTNNPVIGKGSPGEWDDDWVESPTVIYDAQTGTYKMWYTGVKAASDYPMGVMIRIGYAQSSDGKNWVKDTIHNPVLDVGAPGEWDDAWVGIPSVIKRDSTYEMWYSAVSMSDWADTVVDTLKIGYAVSQNGYEWIKYPVPVLTTFNQPYDLEGPWAPDVVFDGNEFRMWYEAKDSATGSNWISYATAPLTAVEEETNRMPISGQLEVMPNPFTCLSGRVAIRYQVPLYAHISLKIYSIAGQLVQTLLDIGQKPGSYTISWDGRDNKGRIAIPGIYFVKLNIGKELSQTRKLLVFK